MQRRKVTHGAVRKVHGGGCETGIRVTGARAFGSKLLYTFTHCMHARIGSQQGGSVIVYHADQTRGSGRSTLMNEGLLDRQMIEGLLRC